MTAEFDRYREGYRDAVQQSIAFMGQDADFFTQLKVRHLLSLAQAHFGDVRQLQLLDVGCGTGTTDRLLIPQVGAVAGVDVSSGMVEEARAANPQARYTTYDGQSLPYDDHAFDLAFAICVLHHVPPPQWNRFVQEVTRVLRPGGLLAIFEHNPLNPLTRLAVLRCEFDRDAVLLGPGQARGLLEQAGMVSIKQGHIVFFPFRGTPFFTWEKRLSWLPLGAQYYVTGVKPPCS